MLFEFIFYFVLIFVPKNENNFLFFNMVVMFNIKSSWNLEKWFQSLGWVPSFTSYLICEQFLQWITRKKPQMLAENLIHF